MLVEAGVLKTGSLLYLRLHADSNFLLKKKNSKIADKVEGLQRQKKIKENGVLRGDFFHWKATLISDI